MKQINEQEVLSLTNTFHDLSQTWHYHLLTPTCQFNQAGRYALVIENISTQQMYVLYTDMAKMELSNKLSIMVHGKAVMDKNNTVGSYTPTQEIQSILSLIHILSQHDIVWHHHVFFPDCTFNTHLDKYELVVEDPRSGNYLSSLTLKEPIEDLKQIESEFYNQTT